MHDTLFYMLHIHVSGWIESVCFGLFVCMFGEYLEKCVMYSYMCNQINENTSLSFPGFGTKQCDVKGLHQNTFM